MKQSLVDRINNTGQKSIKAYDSWPFYGYAGTDAKNHDFTYSEYGAAQASQFIVEIDAALQVWEQWLDGIQWDIKDISTGNVLLSSNIRVIPDGKPGSRFLRAVQEFRQDFKHSYWKSLVLSDWVVGETYVYRVVNKGGKVATGLQWLNPLSVEPDIRQGKIHQYRYSADDSSLIGYGIPANMVAYRMMRRNIFDDLRGKSPILSIIDESNLSRNVKRAFRNYFRNGMTLGGVIMPENPDGELSGREHEVAKNEIQRSLSGTNNAHKWAILQRRMFIEQFQTKDAAKDLNALDLLRKPIMMALGVPEELAGLTGDKSYENVEAAQRAWWSMRAIPYAKDIAEFHNNQIIPYLEQGTRVYIEPNTARYEIEAPEVVSQDVNTGIIDLSEAASKRGYEPDKDLAGIRVIGGQPYSKERLLREANGITPELEKPSADKPDGDSQVSTALGDIPNKEVFGYSGVVTVNEARAQIGLKPLPEKSGSDLQELQSKLAVMVTATQAQIPPEVAALMVGLDIPKSATVATPPPTEQPIAPTVAEEVPTEETPTEDVDKSEHKHIIFDDHHIGIEKFEPAQATALDELEAWRKVATKSGKSGSKFDPYWLRGDIADSLLKSLETATDNKAIHTAFNEAQTTLETYQKAIQATRLDFEGDFDELLKRAREEKFGRVQWASAMRSIIRRYGRRAYEDGLIVGGVLDGNLSETDEDKVAELYATASSYVTKLGSELYKGDGISDGVADNKASAWWNRSMQIFYDEGLLSADRNGMYEFAGSDGEESCDTCTRLKGQRHRLKDWARKGLRPKVDGDNFDCGGFLCEHKLVKVKSAERGKW